MQKMPSIEKIAKCALGEGPHWDPQAQVLYCADVLDKTICKYNPKTQHFTKHQFETPISMIIPIENRKNEFVISLNDQLARISWDGENNTAKILDLFCQVHLSTNPPTSYNDAKCDSLGRLWIGAHVMKPDFVTSDPLGVLYSVDSHKQIQPHIDGIRCTNGLAFNDETQKFFYIDTLKKTVDRFDFDPVNGKLSNRLVWFSLEKHNLPGLPDGMTIDENGDLWVAVFGGYNVLKIDGNKAETLLETVKLPAEQVTSCCFGGPNLDELYVTTGGMEFKGKICDPEIDGYIYRVTGLGVKGIEARNYKLE